MKKILQDRKTLYLVLAIVMVSVFTLSIAYAAMSAVLEIHGNSEVVASSWDIHLENVKVKSGSVSANAPSISGTSSVGFDVELNTPGEFYEFTVDVVNEGSIDAMIDSVVKTPELTTEQAKYIKYEITYENGESIGSKQTLKKGTTTPIKVRVEYRKDIVASDLPSTATELSLKLTLIYVQSDGSGKPPTKHPSSSGSVVSVVSGDGTQVGNEVCIKNECFYVISSTEETITMLAKYNLHVGNTYDGRNLVEIENPTGIQDESAIGYITDEEATEIYPFIGVTAFSDHGVDYNNSIVEQYINNYSDYLETQGVITTDARLISNDEILSLGCNFSEWFCDETAPSWLNSTSYWTGVLYSDNSYFVIYANGGFDPSDYSYGSWFGVRPVITISRDLL